MKELEKKEVEERSLEVLHFIDLDIKKHNTPISKQLEMILKMYKYVVQNIRPVNNLELGNHNFSEEAGLSESSSEERRKFAFEKLRQALISNPGDTASNVILFNYLLFLKGFKSCIVLSESRNQRGEGHLSSLVEVGKNVWYYFDTSLERINFVEDQYGNPEDFSFSWAGLGTNYYSKFYRPLSTVKEIGENELPISSYNVSEESLLRESIESIGRGIPDLSYAGKRSTILQTTNKFWGNEKGRDE